MTRTTAVFGTAALLLLATACAERPVGPGGGEGELQIHAAVNSPTISTLVVEVTAADLTDPLIFNFELIEGVASGTLVVPAGARRTIAVRAYDTEGIETHEGQVLVNIRPGPNPAVPITLRPRTGQQPIEIVLGSFTVAVEPAEALLLEGQTLQVTARVTDVDGAVVGGTADVVWATSFPPGATVDATGLVTAHQGPFSPSIVASFGGVASAARIHVAELAVTSNAFAGMHAAFDAFFSPPVSSLPGGELAGEVVFVGRGCPAGFTGAGSPEDPYLANPAGKIALIERGVCLFTEKVARAQAAGAVGVIVHNNLETLLLGMAGEDPTITIPAVSVQLSAGMLLRVGTPPVMVRVAPVAGIAPAAGLEATGEALRSLPRQSAGGFIPIPLTED